MNHETGPAFGREVGGEGDGADTAAVSAASRAMDALGRVERDGVAGGLEARVFAASVGSLRAGRERGVEHAVGRGAGTMVERRPVEHGRGGGSLVFSDRGVWRQRRVMMAIAAGLGAIVCIGGALVVWRGTGGASGGGGSPIADGGNGGVDGSAVALNPSGIDPASEVEALFAASSLLGSEVGGAWEREIASIEVDAAALGLDLNEVGGGGLGAVGSSSWGGSL